MFGIFGGEGEELYKFMGVHAKRPLSRKFWSTFWNATWATAAKCVGLLHTWANVKQQRSYWLDFADWNIEDMIRQELRSSMKMASIFERRKARLQIVNKRSPLHPVPHILGLLTLGKTYTPHFHCLHSPIKILGRVFIKFYAIVSKKK